MAKFEIVVFILAASVVAPHVQCPDKESQCTTGPCCSDCKFSPEGTPCRQKTAPCAKPGYCTGKSSICSRIIFVPDGTSCDDDDVKKCYQGICLKKPFAGEEFARTQRVVNEIRIREFGVGEKPGRKAPLNADVITRKKRKTSSKESSPKLIGVANQDGVFQRVDKISQHNLFFPIVGASTVLLIISIICARTLCWYYAERKLRLKLETNFIEFDFKQDFTTNIE